MPVGVAITLGILGSNSIRKLLTVNLIKYKLLFKTFAASFRFTVLTLYVVFSFYKKNLYFGLYIHMATDGKIYKQIQFVQIVGAFLIKHL